MFADEIRSLLTFCEALLAIIHQVGATELSDDLMDKLFKEQIKINLLARILSAHQLFPKNSPFGPRNNVFHLATFVFCLPILYTSLLANLHCFLDATGRPNKTA